MLQNIDGSLVKRVLTFIQLHQLIPYGEKLLVGVSGGPDSVCLIHLLTRLRDELGIALWIVHLNHQLRGTEAEADAEYVAQLAQRLGLPAIIERRQVAEYQANHHLSLEEAAREVRYHFFAEVAQSLGIERVALGHTADDQVETILMHLIRGSGIYGLQGMLPISTWQSYLSSNNVGVAHESPLQSAIQIVRPLLEVSREETQAYCYQHQLKPRIDSSNLSLSQLRNRLRAELIPLLQNYNPKFNESLLRTAYLAKDELDFFQQQLTLIWDEAVVEKDAQIAMDIRVVESLHPALQRCLIREVLRKVLGDLKDIELKHIEEIRKGLKLPPGKKLSLPRGLSVESRPEKHLIIRKV